MKAFFRKRKKMTIDADFNPLRTAFRNNNWYDKTDREQLNILKFNYKFIGLFFMLVAAVLLLICLALYLKPSNTIEISINGKIEYLGKYNFIYGIAAFSGLLLLLRGFIRWKLHDNIELREKDISEDA